MKIDLDQAKKFLALFNYQLVTFQFMKRNGDKSIPAGHYTCNYPLTEKDWGHLTQVHKKKAEIFFMVNQGDGVTYPGKKIPRAQKNVNRLTALFMDTDDCPISEVKSYLKGLPLKPHIVVETSPNKFHLYFLLERTPLLDRHNPNFDTQQKNWTRCQLLLSHLGTNSPKTDSTAKDCSRVLRLPGFFHLKNPKDPFLTRIRKLYTHQSYSLDETLELVDHQRGLHNPPAEGYTGAAPLNYYQLPDEKVTPGNRHAQITSLLGHLLNKELDPELAKRTAYQIIREKFAEPKRFLPNGDRHHEIEDFIAFKLNSIKQEEMMEREKARQSLIDQIDNEDNDLELPDDFYTSAPGITGEITREIVNLAHYPLPSFAFATAISLLSVLKGKSVKLPDGTPPTNYFLALAPTGAGKSYAKEVIKHTLYSLNKSYLIESKVRSDRGVLQWLNRNEGIGLLCLDEAEELLRSMESDKSGQHIRNFKTMLLELYSSHNDPALSFGEIASRREDPVVLNYPHFSTIVMGTPNIIDSAFTRKSVTDGLFQRFNIIYSNHGRTPNPNSQLAHSLNGNVYSKLTDLIRMGALAIEEGATTIKISKGADALIDDATDHYNALYNKEIKEGTQLEGIYTRAVEKAKRLAVAMCEGDEIEQGALEYALKFVEKNTSAMRTIANESFNKNQLSKEVRSLQKFIARNSGKEGVCSYRDIARRFWGGDTRSLKILIQDCLDMDFLEQHSIKTTSKGGRPGVAYSVKNI